MSCSNNAFCASLPENLRSLLCPACSKRLLPIKSMEVLHQPSESSLVVLEGLLLVSAFGESELPGTVELQTSVQCLPGRVFSADFFFKVDANNPALYVMSECLTDCYVASFKESFFQNLCDSEPLFMSYVSDSSVRIMYDHAQCIGILREKGAFAKTIKLLKRLIDCKVFLTNNDLARMLATNRTTVSRAISRVKKEVPELWDLYSENKNRQINVQELEHI